ncbi:hypothetical protein CAPTEDRAFT_174449 [Capitella teleta]|uniref:Hexosyltransferase n=1 Tax=Capitella teleta TaxID=283909 RepID=R7V2B4_CAPTE|nr:hypothetical protein CAPTEDRAFT_174449 [Capitella teleta]|eukprot:ELU12998.1 hypothetical protein CAPTEDRAFT_174449 [Capitella teleta]
MVNSSPWKWRGFQLQPHHRGNVIIACLLLPSVYYCYYYNVYEYAMATPFAYFEYPLEVDMDKVVKAIMNNENPGVSPLNKNNFPFVINPDRKCKDEDGNDENIYILFLIKSRMGNFEQRQMIRRTWGREHGIPYVNIRRVFLLGVDPNDKALQHRIGLEAQDHEDIVQQFFVDQYFNNTIKLMMGFQWAVQHCTGARFLAFFDDDYYVNTHNLLNLLQAVKPTEYNNLLLGFIWKNAMPYRIQDKKWYISLAEYPYRFWPPYPTAGSFFVPMETAERIYAAMQYTKIIRFDDVFVGIVAWKLKIELKHNNNLYFYDYKYELNRYRPVIAAHGFGDVERLYYVWKEQHDLLKNE